MEWLDLTKSQRAVLLEMLDWHPRPFVPKGPQWNICRNLYPRLIASIPVVQNFHRYSVESAYLTEEGLRLARLAKDCTEPESKRARIERLYQEAMLPKGKHDTN